MNKLVITLGATMIALGGAAQAQEPKLIACYQRVLVPAQYDVKKILVKEPERKYIKRNGRIELLEYAAIYREEKTLVKDEYYVMQEISCE
ncbi:hypothetical protein ABIE58_002500 [Roseovarius sp. MBR-78]|jgi:hypothetical protein|uniref:hypothetical protein n=1 Tax=Roseovarius sp. MBR-78 TaxID=3156460 RepID=UPI00339B5005